MNQNSKMLTDQSFGDSEDDDPSLLDILVALSENIKIIILLPLMFGIVTYVHSMYAIDPYFSIKTTFIPPSQNNSAASLGVGTTLPAITIAGLAGGSSMPGKHIAYLNSDLLRDKVIERLELTKKISNQSISDLNFYLKNSVEILENKKTGLVELTLTHADQKFAAEILNVYVEILGKLLGSIAAEEARLRREFLEGQLAEAMAKPYRNPALREAVISGLIRESEVSRMGERQTIQNIVQVDVAKPSDRAVGPRHFLRAVIGIAVSLCIVIGFVLVRFFFKTLTKEADSLEKLNRIRRAFGFRSQSSS